MKKIKIILASLGMILGIGLLAPISAGAQVVDPCTIDPTGYLCQHKDDDILVYVNNIINWVIIVLGFLAVIMLIYAGITYVITIN